MLHPLFLIYSPKSNWLSPTYQRKINNFVRTQTFLAYTYAQKGYALNSSQQKANSDHFDADWLQQVQELPSLKRCDQAKQNDPNS